VGTEEHLITFRKTLPVWHPSTEGGAVGKTTGLAELSSRNGVEEF
jgi:hypothetical protein